MNILTTLNQQADEIAKEGHNGWGNTMLAAAETIGRLTSSLATMTSLCKIKYGNLDAGVWQEILANEKLVKEITEGK